MHIFAHSFHSISRNFYIKRQKISTKNTLYRHPINPPPIVPEKFPCFRNHCHPRRIDFAVEACHTLLKRDLRRNLFTLFASWAGPYGKPLTSSPPAGHEEEKSSGASCSELQLSALLAMSGLLCCGPCFNPQSLSEEGSILYQWLDLLLGSKDEKVGFGMVVGCIVFSTMYIFTKKLPSFFLVRDGFFPADPRHFLIIEWWVKSFCKYRRKVSYLNLDDF